MPRIHLASLLAIAIAATPAMAQTAPNTPVRTANIPQADRDAYARMPNTPGSGPYPAVMDTDPTLPDHVIYHPADLARMGGKKLGVLVWGNGGCRDDGASARLHLLEIASHGYLVIAPGRILSGPGITEKPEARMPAPGGQLPPVATTSADVRAGLDWALTRGNRYAARIDPAMTAVSGHSCGGLQALELARDPRINAVLIHNSGVFADGSNPIRGITVTKALLRGIHTPIVYFLGGETDVAFPNGSDDFAKIDHVPAALVSLPVGHGGTFMKPYGGIMAQAAVDWLDWQLRGDMTAARSFTGPACRLCVTPGFTVERKKID